ncbi:hypothetical protein ACFV2X_25300 [Streptomyces sp. NPDC059679]|uniref:hypothetical protein n=1 Tax=Streptomyces sp. NPDC059679 TaxID=3346903 RepID=UPI00368BA110
MRTSPEGPRSIRHTRSSVPPPLAELEPLHADWTFLGAEAIHREVGVTNIDLVELPVEQAMLKCGQPVAVVTASSRFGKHALAPVCPLDAISVFVTDDAIADDERRHTGPGCARSRPPRRRPRVLLPDAGSRGPFHQGCVH